MDSNAKEEKERGDDDNIWIKGLGKISKQYRFPDPDLNSWPTRCEVWVPIIWLHVPVTTEGPSEIVAHGGIKRQKSSANCVSGLEYFSTGQELNTSY
jgi:hypothetical protein